MDAEIKNIWNRTPKTFPALNPRGFLSPFSVEGALGILSTWNWTSSVVPLIPSQNSLGLMSQDLMQK